MPFGLRRMARFALPFLAFAATLPYSNPLHAQERPWTVSSCELLKKPGMYGDTMVSVPGLVLYSGQQFTTHGFDCTDDYGVLKLEFGGNPTDPKDQFRLPMERLEAGTVPLKKDTDYETMQRLMKSATASGQTKMLRATLTGRFFSGPAVGNKSGEVKYPNARLVISEVELVTDRVEDPVDFTPRSNIVPKSPKGCATTELPLPSHEDDDKQQRLSREPAEDLGYLNDPKQVAARAIAARENVSVNQVEATLRIVSEGVAIKDYAWRSADGLRSYAITVNRPYWLLPSTYSADTVIWVPKRVLRTVCESKPAK
jgi:hypothetical protein